MATAVTGNHAEESTTIISNSKEVGAKNAAVKVLLETYGKSSDWAGVDYAAPFEYETGRESV